MAKKAIKNPCPECGEPMVASPFNSKVDILTCKNIHCKKYGTPQGTLPNANGLVSTPMRKLGEDSAP